MALAMQLEQATNDLLNNYVTTKSAAVAAALTEPALIAFTVYIITMGYAIMRGDAADPMHTFVWKVFKVMLIGGLALAGGQYMPLVVGFFDGLQGGMTQAIAGAPSVGALVDDVMRPYEALTNSLWAKASAGTLPKVSLYWAAIVVTLAELWLFLVGVGMYLLSKVALALVLSVGPLFVFCAMFPATQRLTESWVGTVLSFIFLAIFVAASVSMCTDFASSFARHISTKDDTVNILKACVSLAMASFSLGIVILNVKTISSALTGGVSIQGIGSQLTRMFERWLFNRSRSRSAPPDHAPALSDNQIRQHSAWGGTGYGRSVSPASAPLYQRNVLANMRR
jgi:type IV secretion system protein VirB6